MPMSQPILQLRGISKRFGGVQALQSVDFTLALGECVAIIGENGAGKSTLLKALGGILLPDEGEIWVDGRRQDLRSVRDADRLGIRLIHQELNLADDLSVAENVFLGRQPFRGPRWLPLVDRKTMHARTFETLHKVGLPISPQTTLARLSVAQRQLVEIARALSTDARILVFDEPTSSLSLDEANRLLNLIEHLRSRGVAIIYVSHRLQEVARLADRIVVLRDGKQVGTLTGDGINRERMVSLMIGRNLQQLFQRTQGSKVDGPPALDVSGLDFCGGVEPVSFCIRHGEVVGFAGLVGAGRTELAKAVFGIEPARAGIIRVDGKEVRIRSPIDALAAGIALVPEERKTCGLLLQMATDFNLTLASLRRIGYFGYYDRGAVARLASRLQQQLNIVSPDLRRKVGNLSGGNQQKVVLAKWLAIEPRVLILDEPTRGVDVGAKSEIYRLIFDLAGKGMAVMMISSEMEEIVGVCDRVIVMQEGRITGELQQCEISESSVMDLAVGAH
jgi:ribose transport system ATP-binding protein